MYFFKVVFIKLNQWIQFHKNIPSEVAGSNPVGEGAKNSYCGSSSDNLFWIPRDLKYTRYGQKSIEKRFMWIGVQVPVLNKWK